MQCGKERRMAELNILYEDDDILAAVKPAGVDSEAARGLTPDMVNLVRSRLADGKGAPYVGVIQRLDRPVSGVMVFAKNRESAAALSKALREGKFRKVYRAILCGTPEETEGTFTDWLVQEKKGNLTRTGKKREPGAKESKLTYRILRTVERDGQAYSEAEIRLLTGRHHQIRVQFASRGLPLLGDRKYGTVPGGSGAAGPVPGVGDPGRTASGRQLCLCAARLSFPHPKTGKRMDFAIDPPFTL